MTNIEIKTITEAALKKQTWVRKGLEDCLKTWAALTETELNNEQYERLVVFSDETEEGGYSTYYIKRGQPYIYYLDSEAYHYNCFSSALKHRPPFDAEDMTFIKNIIKGMDKKIIPYFKELQSNIDDDSVWGNVIRRLFGE